MSVRDSVEQALLRIATTGVVPGRWLLVPPRPESLPARSGGQARAQIRAGERGDGKADLKWSGGRAGSQ